ncbi:hypothetical protein IRJ41_004759 [Triplophysa rosa]|uniref:Ubiquitin-like domain-containing protein n=1 Tax=Triplophysa rosa TaxID=992332 RepID=A0A9W7X4T6_TRIRA|nr:hypothetical protein IRJ41_004759 [Triplophysa rosa]
MGAIYSYFFGENEPVKPESSSLTPDFSLTIEGEPPESSNIPTVQAPEQPLPLTPQPDETSQVDGINIIVICAGKTLTVDVFPLESISVLLKGACEQMGKKPEKMALVFDGNVLDVKKTFSQYPNLRGGTTVNLIHAC